MKLLIDHVKEYSRQSTCIIAMGTDMNKVVMRKIGLVTQKVEKAKASDLIIAVTVESDDFFDSAHKKGRTIYEKGYFEIEKPCQIFNHYFS